MESPAIKLSYALVRETDQPELYALMQRIYPPVYAHFWPDAGAWYVQSQYGPENFHRELADPRADYRFILEGDRRVGIYRTVAGLPPPEAPNRPATKLHRLYLDPLLHGRGIGRQVVEEIGRRSQESGDELLWLEAMDTSAEALAFYARLGFQRLTHFTLDMPLMYPERRGMWRLVKRWGKP